MVGTSQQWHWWKNFNITYNNYIHLLDGYIFDGNGYKIEINHPIGFNYDTGVFDVQVTDTSANKPNAVLYPSGANGRFHQSGLFRIPEHSYNDIASKKQVVIKNLHYGGTAETAYGEASFFWNTDLAQYSSGVHGSYNSGTNRLAHY